MSEKKEKSALGKEGTRVFPCGVTTGEQRVTELVDHAFSDPNELKRGGFHFDSYPGIPFFP